MQKDGEAQDDFKRRVEAEEGFFDRINSSHGVHVRLGWLSPGKKRQQKEVDVLLAVDMLTHAFHKNMTKAVLISGDRDFKPVVESLVQIGTFIEVAFDPRIGSKELGKAADHWEPIQLSDLCNWTRIDKDESRSEHFPGFTADRNSNCPLMGNQANKVHPTKAYFVL